MNLKSASPIPEPYRRAIEESHLMLNKAGLAHGWHEMEKQHEYLRFLLAPFEDEAFLGTADKAERILEKYTWNAKMLIAAARDREKELVKRAQPKNFMKTGDAQGSSDS